jgi:hypothetical protein
MMTNFIESRLTAQQFRPNIAILYCHIPAEWFAPENLNFG